MAILYTDDTALAFWRWYAASTSTLARPQKAFLSQAPLKAPTESDALIASEYFRDEKNPVHVLVAASASRRKSSNVKYHSFEGPLPPHSVVRISDGVYIITPEFLLVRQGLSLDRIQHLLLCYEFCGTYTINSLDMRGFSSCDSLTTTKRLSRFVSAAAGLRGCKQMRRILPYVLDGSASPRETHVAMRFVLPTAMGGYALPHPELNGRIELNEHQRACLHRSYYVVDVLWRAHDVAVEYDSDAWHSTRNDISRDSRRRNDLKSLGLDVITLTNDELKSCNDFDKVASVVAKRLGKRPRTNIVDYQARKLMLETRLFDAEKPQSYQAV